MSSIALLLPALLLACGPKTPPATPPGLAAQGLPVDPTVTVGQLDNGLRYFIEENPYPAQRVELRLIVRAGSVLERPDQWGGAHFVEHMAFNGTRDFPGTQLVAFLESAGIRFGAHLNAYTSYDETVYKLQVPTDDPELLRTAISVLDNWAEGILFDPEEVERERGVVLEEWRNRRGAGTRTWETTRPVLYADSAYGDHDVIGTEASLQAMTRDALVDFYDTWYRPDLMAVAVVGDLDVEAVRAEIEASFDDNTAPANPRPREPVVLPDQEGVRVLVQSDPELTRSSISLLETTPWRWPTSESEIRDLFIERLFSSILATRLSERARDPSSPFLGAGSGYQDLNRVQGFRTFWAAPRSGQEIAALAAVLEEARRIEVHGVYPVELDLARREMLDAARSWLTEADHSPSSDAIDEIVRHVLDDEWMAGTEAEVKHYEAILPGLTVDDIGAFARSYRTRTSQLVLVNVPGGDGAPPAPTEDAVRAAVTAADTATVEPWPEPSVGGDLVDGTPAPGEVAEAETLDGIGVTRWVLANGATVLVKPTDLANDEIRLSAWSKGGRMMVSDADFHSAVAAVPIAMRSGLGPFSVDELIRALAGREAGVGVSLGDNAESLNGRTRPADLELALQMLHQRFQAPRFEESAFALDQRNRLENLQRRSADPNARLADFLTEVRWNNHPRRKPWTVDDVGRIDLEAAERIYRERFSNAADWQFAIVGDVELEVLQPLVETWIGSLPGNPEQREAFQPDKLPVPNRGPRRETLRAGTEPKAQVRISLDATQPLTRENLHVNGMLGDLLGQALRIRLREDLGGTYGVGVSISQPDLPGDRVTTSIRFACDPDRVEELLSAALGTVEQVRDQPIQASDLQRVLEQARRQRELDLQENGSWLSWLTRYPIRGWDLADIERYELQYDKLLEADTPEALQAVAKRLFHTKSAFVVVQLPEEPADGTAP